MSGPRKLHGGKTDAQKPARASEFAKGKKTLHEGVKKEEIRDLLLCLRDEAVAEMIAQSPETVKILAGLLLDGDETTRKRAVLALRRAAGEGKDISPAVPNLAILLFDKNKTTSKITLDTLSLDTLRQAADKGQDITAAMPALSKYLLETGGNKTIERRTAAAAFSWASQKGQDVSGQIPILAKLLMDADDHVRDYIAATLGSAAEAGPEARRQITDCISQLTRSEAFQKEMTKNSRIYSQGTDAMALVMKWVREEEAKAA
jgi:hypothetical protein